MVTYFKWAGKEILWEETFKLRLKKDMNHVKKSEVVYSGEGSIMDKSPKGEETSMRSKKLREAYMAKAT